MKKKWERGLSLVELLVVVAIIGILAMIAIVNYRNSLQRAKQKKTMTDMRGIAAAWEARGTDMQGYNAGGWKIPDAEVGNTEIEGLLVPTYMKTVPELDGWGQSYQFALDQEIGAAAGATIYAIRSGGANLAFDTDEYTPGQTDGFDCDIVYSNGAFVVFPASK